MLIYHFTHYATIEGSYWLPFDPPIQISSHYLRTTQPVPGHSHTGSPSKVIKVPDRALYIHALRCDDGRIWDVFNGWRT